MSALRRSLSITVILIWRAFQGFVLIPSTVVGSILLCLFLLGERPVQVLLESYYQQPKLAQRAPAVGHTYIKECSLRASSDDPLVISKCLEYRLKEVPLALAIERDVVLLKAFYWPQVFIGLVILLVLYPGRRFLGMSPLPRSLT